MKPKKQPHNRELLKTGVALVVLVVVIGSLLWMMRPKRTTNLETLMSGPLGPATLSGGSIYAVKAPTETSKVVQYTVKTKILETLIDFQDPALAIIKLAKQPGGDNYLIAAVRGERSLDTLPGEVPNDQVGWWAGKGDNRPWAFLGKDIADAIWDQDRNSVIALVGVEGNTGEIVRIDPTNRERTSIASDDRLAFGHFDWVGDALQLVIEPTGEGRSETRILVDTSAGKIRFLDEPMTFAKSMASPSGRYLGGTDTAGNILLWDRENNSNHVFAPPAGMLPSVAWDLKSEKLFGMTSTGKVWAASASPSRIETIVTFEASALPSNGTILGIEDDLLLFTARDALVAVDLKGNL